MPNTISYEQQIWNALFQVFDPEIPVLSVVDLGIIHQVQFNEQNHTAHIIITPTFTACPALHVIQADIENAINQLPFVQKSVVIVDKSIIWTSDKITEQGKLQLKNFGLAPPTTHNNNITYKQITEVICPHCNSDDTSFKALFGSALCRSSHYCYNCKQVFEAFKPI